MDEEFLALCVEFCNNVRAFAKEQGGYSIVYYDELAGTREPPLPAGASWMIRIDNRPLFDYTAQELANEPNIMIFLFTE